MPLSSTVGGTVEGCIDDWQAYDRYGKPIDGRKDPKWKTADAIGFMLPGLRTLQFQQTLGFPWRTIASLRIRPM